MFFFVNCFRDFYFYTEIVIFFFFILWLKNHKFYNVVENIPQNGKSESKSKAINYPIQEDLLKANLKLIFALFERKI